MKKTRGSIFRFRLAYAGLVMAGAAAFPLASYNEADSLLLGMIAATVGVITFLRQHVLRAQRWYIHGYHAGYHAGQPAGDCYGPSCMVLTLAQETVELDA